MRKRCVKCKINIPDIKQLDSYHNACLYPSEFINKHEMSGYYKTITDNTDLYQSILDCLTPDEEGNEQ